MVYTPYQQICEGAEDKLGDVARDLLHAHKGHT